jgi:hypothetical protein
MKRRFERRSETAEASAVDAVQQSALIHLIRGRR